MKSLLVCLALLLVVPVAAPLPATCADPCGISARTEAYVPPAAVIASGARVVFSSADIGHFTSDGGLVGAKDTCFGVAQSPGNPSPPVTFTIAGGALHASYTDATGAHDAVCASATALPDGSFALPYYCKIHTNMRAVLVVSP